MEDRSLHSARHPPAVPSIGPQWLVCRQSPLPGAPHWSEEPPRTASPQSSLQGYPMSIRGDFWDQRAPPFSLTTFAWENIACQSKHEQTQKPVFQSVLRCMRNKYSSIQSPSMTVLAMRMHQGKLSSTHTPGHQQVQQVQPAAADNLNPERQKREDNHTEK